MGSVLRNERRKMTQKEWGDEMMLFFARFNFGQFELSQTPTNRGGIWTPDRRFRAMIEKLEDGIFVGTCFEAGESNRVHTPFATCTGTLRQCIWNVVTQLNERSANEVWRQMDNDNKQREKVLCESSV